MEEEEQKMSKAEIISAQISAETKKKIDDEWVRRIESGESTAKKSDIVRDALDMYFGKEAKK